MENFIIHYGYPEEPISEGDEEDESWMKNDNGFDEDLNIKELKQKIRILERKKGQLENKVAFRPQPSQYPALCRYVGTFVSNIFGADRLVHSAEDAYAMMRKKLYSCAEEREEEEFRVSRSSLVNLISSFKNASSSCVRLSHQLEHNYPLYSDVTTNVTSAFQQCAFALELISTSFDNLQQPSSFHHSVQALSLLSHFPQTSSSTLPPVLLTSPTNSLTPFHKRQLKCQLLLLRNQQLLGTPVRYHSVCEVMHVYVTMWKRDEEEKKKRQMEKESFFRFKASSTTSSLSEEDQDALEIKQRFQQFTEVSTLTKHRYDAL